MTSAPETSEAAVYSTFAAAYRDGWEAVPDWYPRDLNEYPLTDEPVIRVRDRYLVRRAGPEAKSQTQWRREGFVPINDNEQWHGWRWNKRSHQEYVVYLPSQVVPIRKSAPPQSIDIMDAIREISRAAKRYRDAAQAHYQSGTFAFASWTKHRKEACYRLKDQCVAHLIQEGRLQHVEYHRFGERWASLVSPPGRPEIRLHVPCEDPQQPGLVVQDLGDQIPAGKRRKIRVKDAIHTCEQYLEGRPTLKMYSWPAPVRPREPQECYDCGGEWAYGECQDGCGRVAFRW